MVLKVLSVIGKPLIGELINIMGQGDPFSFVFISGGK